MWYERWLGGKHGKYGLLQISNLSFFWLLVSNTGLISARWWEHRAPKVGGWCSNLLMELDSSRIKSTTAAPRKQHREACASSPLYAHSPLPALSFRELNRKINLHRNRSKKKKKRIVTKGLWKREKRTGVKFAGRFSGARMWACLLNKSLGKSSVYKRQNDSCSNTGRLAGFIYKTNYWHIVSGH